MRKNRKNGFLFFDLLIALMMLMVFITLIFLSISFLTYHYTINRDLLCAESLLSELVFDLEQGKIPKSDETKTINNIDFLISIRKIMVQHTQFCEVKEMPLSFITISWVDLLDKKNILSCFIFIKKQRVI